MNAANIASLVVVGALWGCTNPWLRKGSSEVRSNHDESYASETIKWLPKWLQTFSNVKVWLPYALNQCGSLVYSLWTLQTTPLSVAVMACNGLSLVFSIVTSHLMGERVHEPFLAFVGSLCVLVGTTLCALASRDNDE